MRLNANGKCLCGRSITFLSATVQTCTDAPVFGDGTGAAEDQEECGGAAAAAFSATKEANFYLFFRLFL
jgi:hypothetical protein